MRRVMTMLAARWLLGDEEHEHRHTDIGEERLWSFRIAKSYSSPNLSPRRGVEEGSLS